MTSEVRRASFRRGSGRGLDLRLRPRLWHGPKVHTASVPVPELVHDLGYDPHRSTSAPGPDGSEEGPASEEFRRMARGDRKLADLSGLEASHRDVPNVDASFQPRSDQPSIEYSDGVRGDVGNVPLGVEARNLPPIWVLPSCHLE